MLIHQTKLPGMMGHVFVMQQDPLVKIKWTKHRVRSCVAGIFGKICYEGIYGRT